MEAKNYYFDAKHLEVNQEGRGVKVHPLVALALSAAVGGLFVVFLPFIGLYMFAGFLLKKAGVELGSLFHTAVAPTAVGSAYLTGAPPKEDGIPGKGLAALDSEIKEKRQNQ